MCHFRTLTIQVALVLGGYGIRKILNEENWYEDNLQWGEFGMTRFWYQDNLVRREFGIRRILNEENFI